MQLAVVVRTIVASRGSGHRGRVSNMMSCLIQIHNPRRDRTTSRKLQVCVIIFGEQSEKEYKTLSRSELLTFRIWMRTEK